MMSDPGVSDMDELIADSAVPVLAPAEDDAAIFMRDFWGLVLAAAASAQRKSFPELSWL